MRIVKKIIKIFLLSAIALVLLGVGVTYVYGEKIEQIIDELERSAISSKRLYKIFKKTHLPKKMIIDMHRLIMNLWRDFTNEKIDR